MLKKFALGILAAVVATVAAGTTTVHAQTKDVVETAVAAGSFKTLATALEAAGLVSTLKGPGPFTVFAPTDQAFAKLPAGTLETLLKPENKEKLQRILTFHVVSGKVMASDVVKLTSAKAVSGDTITINVHNGVVHVDAGDRDESRCRGQQRRHPRNRHRARSQRRLTDETRRDQRRAPTVVDADHRWRHRQFLHGR